MLRASSEIHGETVDIQAIAGRNTENSGIPGGAALITLCEAALGDDPDALVRARQGVRDALGDAELVDACAVIGNFERMTRIADGTGIPLDAPVMMLTEDFREELGIDRYGAAANSKPLSGAAKLAAPLVRRAARYVLPLLGRVVARKSADRPR